MIQGADNVQALSKELKKSGRMHPGGIPRGTPRRAHHDAESPVRAKRVLCNLLIICCLMDTSA